MAVRGVKRNSNAKRCTYVYEEEFSQSSIDDFSSSGDDTEYTSNRQPLVGCSKSIKNLLKDGESYRKSDEHAYTQVAQRACLGKRKRETSENDVSSTRRKTKRARCESRNAVNARLNREKKKAYVASLEAEIQELKEGNKLNFDIIAAQKASISSLQDEVSHLRSMLSNNKYIGALVSKLSEVTGLPVTSSLARQPQQGAARNARTRTWAERVLHSSEKEYGSASKLHF